jgi:hypothetical protein
MQARVLAKLFGHNKQWHGACTVVLNADASIQTSGTDSIVNGGAKVYAPRLISGRVAADAACLLPEEVALVLVQHTRIRQATGEDHFQQTVMVVDAAHVAAVEFSDGGPLATLGLPDPPSHVPAPIKTRG